MITASEARGLMLKRPVTSEEISTVIRRTAEASGIRIVRSSDFNYRPLMSDALKELEEAGYDISVTGPSHWTVRW